MQAVQHQRGLEPYSHWEALPVKQPLHSYLPLSYIPKFYECSCNSADRRHVGFEPVFHSSNTALDSWNERWWDLIWTCRWLQCTACGKCYRQGDSTFASLSSSPPPTRRNDIYRVPCSGLWPWKPLLLLNAHPTIPATLQVCQTAKNVGMERLQGQNGWLTCVYGLCSNWKYGNQLQGDFTPMT